MSRTFSQALSGSSPEPKGPAPSNGKDIGEFLLDAYAQQYPDDAKGNSHKWNMFREIVMRSAFDIAGSRYAQSEDGARHSRIDGLFEKLEQKGKGKESLQLVLENLPSYTKGFVQTPHPTEVLSKDAIDAEQAMYAEFETNRKLFNGSLHKDIAEDEKRKITGCMHELFEKMQPVIEQMTPQQEMKRSLYFSEKMFDSIPIMAQNVLNSAAGHGAYGHQPLDYQQLCSFNFLLQPDTWSPGDRDSKEEMTSALLEQGIGRSQRILARHYVRKLAEVIAETPDAQLPENLSLKTELRTVLWRQMKNLLPQYMERYIQRHLEGKIDPEALNEIKQLNNIRLKMRDGERADALKALHIVDRSKYANAQELLEDLMPLLKVQDAQGHDVKYPAYKFADGTESKDLSKLEVLFMQVNNFGDSALKSQIRENSEMHAGVMKSVLDAMETAGLHVKGYDPARYGIDENKLSDKDPAQKKLKTEILDYKRGILNEALEMLLGNKQLGSDIQKTLLQELRTIKADVEESQADKKNGALLNSTAQAEVNLYETLKGFRIAAENPKLIPRYLIAECHSDVNILEAFFLLKAMEPDRQAEKPEPQKEKGALRQWWEKSKFKKLHDSAEATLKESRDVLPDKDPSHKVEIVPLVEYRDDVQNISDMMKRVYKNKYFREHHNSITNLNDPAISKVVDFAEALPFDISKHLRNREQITVAEVKKAYGLSPKAGDDTRQIKTAKMVMGAGSDIMKSAGAAGGALVQNMFEDLRANLLDLPEPVLLIEYTGSGGGIHRSQPVTSPFETQQGRSMRQSSDSIASKALISIVNFLEGRLGLNDDAQDRKKTKTFDSTSLRNAQLNLGNMLGLPRRKDLWNQETEQRVKKHIDKYQDELYEVPMFSAYIGYTANKFVKLAANYAARSSSRVGANPDDVNQMRAIGYGAALNASGSCAIDYFGASAFLGLDERGNIPEAERSKLARLYLEDFKVQDVVNRASYGITMADMDTAWTYLGYKRNVDQQGQVTLSNGKETKTVDELLAHVPAWSDDEKHVHTPAEKRAAACYMLAKIDNEYQRVSKGLLQLQQKAEELCGVQPARLREGTDAEKLLAELPATLRFQIEQSRNNINPGRRELAQVFQEAQEGKIKLPKNRKELADKDPELFTKLYSALGGIMECFEHVPRAYTRPTWAIAYEAQNQAGKTLN